MLGHGALWVNALGLVLVAQTLVWSAYFIHEFTHQSIFKTPAANERWGTLMAWINGSCYARFADLRRKHMRHHVDRADIVSFDLKERLDQFPAWLRRCVISLEWAYFPAVEFLMRAFVMMLPFQNSKKKSARLRIVFITVVRLLAFAAMAWWSVKAVALYFVAYVVFITVLRFADCFQHTYDAYAVLDDQPIPTDKVRDRAYEQANTYSDFVGLNRTWLNLVWLNFGFHNAHHERPTAPWHRLPAFHRELYAADYAQVVTVPQLLRSFHINRVRRIVERDYGHVGPVSADGRADTFVGAVGVSFLTAV